MPLMRLRMYGSTETKTLRTRTSPSPGLALVDLAEREVRLLRRSLRPRGQHDLAGHGRGVVDSPSICFAGSSPAPSSAFIFASSSSTWPLCEICCSWRSMSSLVPRDVVERARRGQLLDRARARLHLLRLVLRALDRTADVGHVVADPARRLADPHLRLGGRVLRLDDFLLRAERLDLRLQRALALDQLLLLRLELLALGS